MIAVLLDVGPVRANRVLSGDIISDRPQGESQQFLLYELRHHDHHIGMVAMKSIILTNECMCDVVGSNITIQRPDRRPRSKRSVRLKWRNLSEREDVSYNGVRFRGDSRYDLEHPN
jgi:hypothetical protein